MTGSRTDITEQPKKKVIKPLLTISRLKLNQNVEYADRVFYIYILISR